MAWRTAFWLVLFAAIAGEASANQPLYSLNYEPDGAHAPAHAPQGLQFLIDFESPVNPGHPEDLGQQAYWQDQSSGSYDFNSGNSPEFADLVQILTNGIDDEIVLLTHIEFYGGGGEGMLESEWGFGNPDLAGNQIDFIRLVVHDLSIQPYSNPPYGEGLQWNSHITWEFWGTPLPEPASAFLLLCGSALFRRSPRSRRRDS
jgi:hypothetical protein